MGVSGPRRGRFCAVFSFSRRSGDRTAGVGGRSCGLARLWDRLRASCSVNAGFGTMFPVQGSVYPKGSVLSQERKEDWIWGEAACVLLLGEPRRLLAGVASLPGSWWIHMSYLQHYHQQPMEACTSSSVCELMYTQGRQTHDPVGCHPTSLRLFFLSGFLNF